MVHAKLLFKEKEFGSLEVGKFADLVVLDRDYLRVPANKIEDITPLLTITGGQYALSITTIMPDHVQVFVLSLRNIGLSLLRKLNLLASQYKPGRSAD